MGERVCSLQEVSSVSCEGQAYQINGRDSVYKCAFINLMPSTVEPLLLVTLITNTLTTTPPGRPNGQWIISQF